MGDTPILFFSVTSRMFRGENNDGIQDPAGVRKLIGIARRAAALLLGCVLQSCVSVEERRGMARPLRHALSACEQRQAI
jgi:hypothetical protein